MEKTRMALQWAFGEVFVKQFLSLSISLFIAKIVGPEAYGLVAMATVFTAFLDIFEKQGIRQALIQREHLTDAHLNTAFWSSITLGVLLWCVAFEAKDLVARMYSRELLIDIIPALALSLPLQQLVVVQQAVIERQLNYKLLATRTAISISIGGVTGVTMAYAGFGVWSLVAQQIVTKLVAVLSLWSIATWRPRLQWNLAAFMDIWSYGRNLFGAALLEFSNKQIDRLLIGILWGATALGVYEFSKKIFQAVMEVTVSTGVRVSFPILSRVQNLPETFMAELVRFIGWTCLIIYPLYAYLIIWAPDIVPIAFGNRWSESGQVLRIFLGIGFVQAVQFYLINSLLALGKSYERLRLTMINTAGNFLALAVTSSFGLQYIACGIAVRAYLFLPANMRMLHSILPAFGMRNLLRSIAKPAINTIVFSTTTYGMILMSDKITAFAFSSIILAGYYVHYFIRYRTMDKLTAEVTS